MGLEFNSTNHVTVEGKDREGHYWNLPIIELISHAWGRDTIIVVELPFSVEHRIWEELRNE